VHGRGLWMRGSVGNAGCLIPLAFPSPNAIAMTQAPCRDQRVAKLVANAVNYTHSSNRHRVMSRINGMNSHVSAVNKKK